MKPNVWEIVWLELLARSSLNRTSNSTTMPHSPFKEAFEEILASISLNFSKQISPLTYKMVQNINKQNRQLLGLKKETHHLSKDLIKENLPMVNMLTTGRGEQNTVTL